MTERKARGSTKMGVTAPEHLMGAVKVARDNYLVERWWKYGQPAIDLIEATINVRNMVDAGQVMQHLAGLQGKDLQRVSRSPWQPLDDEERHDRHLSRHEQLPDMRGGPLVGLTRRAE